MEVILAEPIELTEVENGETKHYAEHSREILSEVAFTHDVQGSHSFASARPSELVDAGESGCLPDEAVTLDGPNRRTLK